MLVTARRTSRRRSSFRAELHGREDGEVRATANELLSKTRSRKGPLLLALVALAPPLLLASAPRWLRIDNFVRSGAFVPDNLRLLLQCLHNCRRLVAIAIPRHQAVVHHVRSGALRHDARMKAGIK